MLPTYFISHGGGPWPYLTGGMRDAHAKLEAALRDMPRQLATRPRAVLMVSAHWEAPAFTVTGHRQPAMIYDYSGFPANTYAVTYPSPGAPALASQVHALVEAAGLPGAIDPARGYDHGMFAPMSVIFPEADLPVVQLSLQHGYDPAAHLALGRAIAPLRDEGVLIIGSGLSYHNMRMRMGGPSVAQASKAFDDWLTTTLVDHPAAERAERLEAWTHAPGARESHPEEDHLLPLMVAVGAAGEDHATRVYHEDGFLGSASVSSYRFDHR